MQITHLNSFEEHPFKHQLGIYGIKQYDIAKSIGISQSSLSRMLNGIEPMKEIVEDEIFAVLNFIKEKNRPKHIIKRT